MSHDADSIANTSFVEAFYVDYIARSEELQAAIQRGEWSEITRYVAWREEKLTQLDSLPRGPGALETVHKEYLNRIMVLELANINALNEIMNSLKSSIRESQEQIQLLRYSDHA